MDKGIGHKNNLAVAEGTLEIDTKAFLPEDVKLRGADWHPEGGSSPITQSAAMLGWFSKYHNII